MFKAGLSKYSFWLLLILGLVLEGLFLQFSRIRDVRLQWTDALLYFGAAYALYILIVIYISFFWDRSFFSPELIVVVGVIFRFTLLFSPPLLSDDVYRYVWDGKVANMGINPYSYSPDSDNLIGLRDDDIYPKIVRKSVHTVDPPLMQFLFRGVTFFSPTVTAMKIALAVFDVASILILFLMLRFLERSLAWALVYAWNPLVVIEFAGNGHGDSVAIFLFMLGLYLALRTRGIWSGILLSFSFAAKWFGIVALPFVEDIRSRWKEILVILVSFSAIVFVLYIPYLDAGALVFAGLKPYAFNPEFNSSLYAPLVDKLQDYFAGDPSPNSFLWWVTDNKAGAAAQCILFCAGFCFMAGVWIRHTQKSYEEQKENILYAAYLVMAALTLLNPAAYAWHLIWIVPFLCFFPNPAWMLLSGTIFLSYRIFNDYTGAGPREQSSEIRMWEYIPFYGMLTGHFLWITITKKLKAHPPEASK